ncbi:flavodoxin [bacterium]|nr:flavodoxin [bacterium]
MKKHFALLLAVGALLMFLVACTAKQEEKKVENPESTQTEPAQVAEKSTKEEQVSKNDGQKAKTLIIYFSYSGNTKKMAESIQQKLPDSDIYELKTVQTYPASYRDCVDQAKKEQENEIYPELKEYPDVSSYETIFIGAPNWWGDYPMPVYGFIKKVDLSKKTVIPFCTHGGSGGEVMFKNLLQATGSTEQVQGLAIFDKNLDTMDKAVEDWLKEIDKI